MYSNKRMAATEEQMRKGLHIGTHLAGADEDAGFCFSNQTLRRILERGNGKSLKTGHVLQRKVKEEDKTAAEQIYRELAARYGLEEDTHTRQILEWALDQCDTLDEAKCQLDDDLLEYMVMKTRSWDGRQEALRLGSPESAFSEGETAALPPREIKSSPRRYLLDVIRRSPGELAPLFAENSIDQTREDMPYYHHAQMVLGQFEKYFAGKASSSQDVIGDDMMREMLAFHDIHKQRSIERHGKIGEHMETAAAMAHFVGEGSMTALQKRISVAMVSADPLGDFFKEIDSIDGVKSDENRLCEEACCRCARQIQVQAGRAGVSADRIGEFFVRYMQFYQSDYSSYSTDSEYVDRQEPGGDPQGRHMGPKSFTPEPFVMDLQQGGLVKEETGFLQFSSQKRNHWMRRLNEILTGQSVDSQKIRRRTAAEARVQAGFEDENLALRGKMESAVELARERREGTPYLDFRRFLEEIYMPRASGMGLLKLIAQIADGKEPLSECEESQRKLWSDYCLRIMSFGGAGREDRLLEDFTKPLDGVFIRKLLPEYGSAGAATSGGAREVLERERRTILEGILRQPMTPFVLPATFVVEGVPTNLTDAGGELLHSSGIIYDKSVKLAPSSKEHNESAHLSHVLTGQVRPRIHDEETWRGIVRKAIHPIGGVPFETREELALKMHEMADRQSGRSPDLSTKELLQKIVEDLMAANPGLEGKIDEETFEKGCAEHTASEAVKIQLMGAYKLYRGSKPYLSIEDISGRTKLRRDRIRSIYGGGKRGLPPGNRYHVEGAPGYDPRRASSEQSGYDGRTFQTNEALLLPDGIEHIQGVYVNRRTIAGLIHALNLALEFPVQMGRDPGLYTYEALEGLRPIKLSDIFVMIEARMKEGEGLFEGCLKTPASSTSTASDGAETAASSLQGAPSASAAAPSLPPVEEEKDAPTAPQKPVLTRLGAGTNKLLGLFSSQVRWLPDQEPPKERGK